MERSLPPRIGDSSSTLAADHPAWWLLFLALLAWQGWMTLSLFGGERPWQRLLDDQPILSGRHPLHLYHGYLGARALRDHGNLSCYDPTFHAGYPKTPVFDSGSRPAELLMTVAGGRYCPAAYKIGLALVCVFAPLLLFTAARSVGLSRAAACLACALGLLVWWGQPCRDTLEAGEVDLLLATLLVLAQAGLLIRFHHDPGLLSWLGVVGTALLGWFAHPLLLVLLLPLFLIYYLSVGTRHRLAWHLTLLGGLLGAIAINGFWLIDWIGYWWIRVPPHLETPLLAHRTLRTIWEAPLWGGPVDKALACVLVLAAAMGVLLYNKSSQRATARLLGLAWGGFLILSVVGLTWEPFGRFGAHHLLAPALLFAALPAAHAVCAAVRLAWQRRGTRWATLTIIVAAAAYLWHAPPPALGTWATRLLGVSPLHLGLDAEQRALIETLQAHTTSQARILWEDRRSTPLSEHWTALLPLLTERAYVGGLDPDAGIEYTASGLSDQFLAGKPVRDWKGDELREYCDRYNIGWVACWSPTTRERFQQWDRAEMTVALPPCGEGESPGCLFKIRRTPSFALVGSARWLGADSQRIVLGDVVPHRGGANSHRGQVLLSLHYQEGMHVAPSRVHLESYRIETANLSFDSPPFVRLWVDEPVTRVTITWDKR
ncbi:MAG TPA: hypothetical protein VN688_33135 [Gemmataceae bacterium]|nr:hypothetical protein [Gemmataceae bacterium]